MASGITTLSLGEGRPGFYETFPLVEQSTWRDVWAVFPYQGAFNHPALAERLNAHPELQAPHYLESDSPPPKVNAFLAAINEAFPRGPPDSTTTGGNVGPRTNPRE